MNTLILTVIAAMPPSARELLWLLLYVAIACVVIWAIQRLLAWAGWTIPEPIKIIFIALLCILGIIWLFKFFGLLI